MARRRQTTTAMPKKDRRVIPEQDQNASFFDKMLGSPKTRIEREEALNRFIQRTILITAVAVLIIVASALIYENVIVPNFSVATVNGENITVQEFRERFLLERALVFEQANVRYSQIQQQAAAFGMDPNQLVQQDPLIQQWQRELQFPDTLGQRVINEMVDDVLLSQEARSRDISVSVDGVQNTINQFFGYDPTQVALIGTPATETPIPSETPTPFVSPTVSPTLVPTVTPTAIAEATSEATAEATGEATEVVALPTIPASPTPSQEDRLNEFQDTVTLFRENIQSNEASSAALDDFFERQALQEALAIALFGDGETAIFVDLRQIVVASEESANTILAALQSGEAFGELARANSTDEQTSTRGGEVGSTPLTLLPVEVATAIEGAEIGALLGPIEVDGSYYIVQVREIKPEEVVTSQQLRQIRATQVQNWVEARRAEVEAANGISISDSWPDYLP